MRMYKKPELELSSFISDVITSSSYDVFEDIAESDNSKTIKFSDEIVQKASENW